MEKNELFENACRMWRENAEELSKMPTSISESEYVAVFEAIRSCKGRVATMGMGTSSVAARKIAHMLCVANVPS
ncbi:MAG: phosphosugar isomerase, partial [Clostridia bacterium]|nr:phosphosugar isomerase [Clostridia bacterium]